MLPSVFEYIQSKSEWVKYYLNTDNNSAIEKISHNSLVNDYPWIILSSCMDFLFACDCYNNKTNKHIEYFNMLYKKTFSYRDKVKEFTYLRPLMTGDPITVVNYAVGSVLAEFIYNAMIEKYEGIFNKDFYNSLIFHFFKPGNSVPLKNRLCNFLETIDYKNSIPDCINILL